MPFGLIFAAIYFFLAAWTGVQLLSAPGPQAKLAGLSMAVLGITLALGLLSRRTWARWTGVVCATGMALFGIWQVNRQGEPLDFLILLAGLGTAMLLLVPATGATPASEVPQRPASRSLPAVVAVAALGLVGSALWGLSDRGETTSASAPALSASLNERVRWSDFGSGIDVARRKDKPLLVNFNAAWCGYCKKMDRETWKHPSVVERLDDFVTVRVDIDEQSERNGYVGAELAARYRVSGTPTQMILDPQGRVMGVAGGFQSPRDLLTWIEDSLGRRSAGRTPA